MGGILGGGGGGGGMGENMDWRMAAGLLVLVLAAAFAAVGDKAVFVKDDVRPAEMVLSLPTLAIYTAAGDRTAANVGAFVGWLVLLGGGAAGAWKLLERFVFEPMLAERMFKRETRMERLRAKYRATSPERPNPNNPEGFS